MILDIVNILEGTTGTINDVTEEKVTVDGEEKEKFTVTINDKILPFYGEGKIASFENILAAKGKQAVLSYVKSIEEDGQPPQEMLIFLQGDVSAAGVSATAQEQSAVTAGENKNTNMEVEKTKPEKAANVQSNVAEDENSESTASLSVVWTIVIGLLLIVGVIILLSGRKKV